MRKNKFFFILMILFIFAGVILFGLKYWNQQSQKDYWNTFISDDSVLSFQYPSFLEYSHASHAGSDLQTSYSFYPKGSKLDQSDYGHLGNDVINVNIMNVEGELNPWHMNTKFITKLNGYKAIIGTSDPSKIVIDVLSPSSKKLAFIVVYKSVFPYKDQIMKSIQIRD